LLFGVEELKKVLQLVLISAMLAAEPPEDAAEAAVDAADDAGAAADEEEALEPLEQADMAATSARPSAGAR
jgi:hypothetical protein